MKTSDSQVEANGGVWWPFTVGQPVVTFGKVTPGAGAIATTNAVNLVWSAAMGASFYEVCIDTSNNGACDTSWQLNGTATSRIVTGLTDGTYYWQVRAQTANGMTPADAGLRWSLSVDAPDPIREYIYFGSKLLASLTLTTGTPVLTYYHTDVLGSVRVVTDVNGAQVGLRNDYFPFGESASPVTGDPRRFTGKERDSETAFDYFDARYYRNIWGRFTTPDPVVAVRASSSDPQRWNRYSYARVNPLRFADPTGLIVTADQGSWDLIKSTIQTDLHQFLHWDSSSKLITLVGSADEIAAISDPIFKALAELIGSGVHYNVSLVDKPQLKVSKELTLKFQYDETDANGKTKTFKKFYYKNGEGWLGISVPPGKAPNIPKGKNPQDSRVTKFEILIWKDGLGNTPPGRMRETVAHELFGHGSLWESTGLSERQECGIPVET